MLNQIFCSTFYSNLFRRSNRIRCRNSGEIIDVSQGICREFSIDEILVATHGFSDSFVIGHGGFSTVYKGKIQNGTQTVAIKRFNSMSPKLRKEFRDEILMVSKFRHSHLVSLIGYCETNNERILVYEYMASGSLDNYLHKIGNKSNPLSWIERLKIGIAVARGLDYLHTGTSVNNKVIHRDIKSSNILLDHNRTIAKIADFGLSKIGPANQEDTRVMTRVMGTFGYLDLDYFKTGYLTSKSDVYAFGVVLFELLCERPAVNTTLVQEQQNLAHWVQLCVKEGNVAQIIDPNLKSEIMPRSLSVFVEIAHRCLNELPEDRPTMMEVLNDLALALSLQNGSTMTEKPEFYSVEPQHISGNDAVDHATEFRMIDQNDEMIQGIANIQLDELKEITNNFSNSALIGQEPNADIYYGILQSGASTAIKKFHRHTFTSNQEFFAQVSAISRLEHENIVELVGYSVSNNNNLHLLAYEYPSNGTLHDILHGGVKGSQRGRVLSWSQRVKIAVGAAKGLQFLHENTYISKYITSHDVLIFDSDVAKIADFDFDVLGDQIDYLDLISAARSLGSSTGHPAPGFAITRVIGSKSDVYSFGVVLLELLTGRKFIDFILPHELQGLVTLATPTMSADEVKQSVDPRLNGEYHPEALVKIAAVAVSCVQYEAEFRPNMDDVVEALQSLL